MTAAEMKKYTAIAKRRRLFRHALLAVLLLTQAADASLLWHALGVIGPWVLLPLLLLSLCTWPIALTRRKRP